MKLNNLKVGTRLALMLCILLSLMLLMTTISQSGMSSMQEKTDIISQNRIPKILLLQKGEAALGDIRVSLRDMILATNQNERQLAKERILSARATIGSAWEKLKPTLVDTQAVEIFSNIQQLREKFIDIQNRIINLSETGKIEEARAALPEVVATATKYKDLVRQLIDRQNELALQSGQEAKDKYEHVHLELLISSAVGIVLSIAMGLIIAKSITKPLVQAVDAANKLASGDLTIQLNAEAKDETGMLIRAMDQMARKLSEVIGEVIAMTGVVASSAEHLSTAARQVSIATEAQANATTSSSAAVEQLSVSMDRVASSAQEANAKVVVAGQLALESVNSVNSATGQAKLVSDSINNSSSQVESLSNSVVKIGDLASIIQEIADQTNLLALNAAIEAARAGEQGRGFAVVADEVRKLAERTTGSVQEIGGMIQEIQEGATEATTAMKENTAVVGQVVALSDESSTSIVAVSDAAKHVIQLISEIASAMDEQKSASESLAQNVEAIAQMSEENTSALASVAETAHNLSTTSKQLATSVSYFQIS